MTTLDRIQDFARGLAEDGHQRGDVEMTLPEQPWLSLLQEANVCRMWHTHDNPPPAAWDPVTIDTSYGFCVVVKPLPSVALKLMPKPEPLYFTLPDDFKFWKPVTLPSGLMTWQIPVAEQPTPEPVKGPIKNDREWF